MSGAERVLDRLLVTLDQEQHEIGPDVSGFIPPDAHGHLHSFGEEPARFHWIREA